ncbi:MAG: hypothetical protein JW755_07920 [Candidatus Aminicenantes bacterium]|nr:hypothetical protein [Candidatus Aminicenantes bacterium]
MLKSMVNDLGMTTISVFKVFHYEKSPGRADIILRVMFEDESRVIIENWSLKAILSDEGWQLTEKQGSSGNKDLYKINMPSERMERVDLFEISYHDIKLQFRDAVVFYDNLPDIETALIVIGAGKIWFSPSLDREKHQLELVLKNKILEDDLKYAYLRFSNHFFNNNVRIRKNNESYEPVNESEKKKAYSLFTKHYSRSFTIQNSLDNRLLSFLPQGEETVFEFETKKHGIFTYIYSPFAEEEINLFQWSEGRILNLYSPQMTEGERTLFIQFGAKYSIKHYQIDVDFDPDGSFISGKARINLISKVNSLDGIKLKINSNIEILRIADEDDYTMYYTQDKLRKTLYVYFLNLPPRGQDFFIDVYYRGKIESEQHLSDVITISHLSKSYSLIPFNYDTHLFSQSMYWYPSPPEDDFFTARLRILVPPKYTCISNGRLVEKSQILAMERVEDLEDVGNSAYVFEIDKPVRYLSFIVGKFREFEGDSSTPAIKLFRTADTRSSLFDILRESQDIVRFYQGKFGAFPYEKLSLVQRTWKTSGGHSPASFIVLNQPPVRPDVEYKLKFSSPIDLSKWKEYFIAHEIAHQWWGQSLGWDSYGDQWLSEGLAQFASVLYLAEKYGDKVYEKIMERFTKSVKKYSDWGAITMGSRISYFDFDAYQSIIYNKAALVILMLKDLLGEDLFYYGLQRFYRNFKFMPARTNDFIRTFQDITDRDLSVFFRQWFYSHHLPELRADYSVIKNSNGYELSIKIAQLTERFVFPLFIAWEEKGEKIEKRVIVDRMTEHYSFNILHKPKNIKINNKERVPALFR